MPLTELLRAWRDATRAAELADRLTAEATEAALHAEDRAAAAEEVAALAQEAAEAAARAAERAARVADEATRWAVHMRERKAVTEDEGTGAHRLEADAKDGYQDAADRQATSPSQGTAA